jgi:hypothetical protein
MQLMRYQPYAAVVTLAEAVTPLVTFLVTSTSFGSLFANSDKAAPEPDEESDGYVSISRMAVIRREARDFSRAPLDVLALMGTLGG